MKKRRYRNLRVVYGITNIKTGRMYVGCSLSMMRRWDDHLAQLNRGNHPLAQMQKDFNRFGIKALRFEILEVVPRYSAPGDREMLWIRKLHSESPGMLYNKQGTKTDILRESKRGDLRIWRSESYLFEQKPTPRGQS